MNIKALGKGIELENELVSILLYADDIVLLAANEADLQFMLDMLHEWCDRNSMVVNCSKSNIVHFRQPSVARTVVQFMCGNELLVTVDKYKYLGIVLNETLDYNFTAKMIAQSAGRALGLIIAKTKYLGGLPHDVFKKLFDSMVWPVIAYGAAIWGTRSYACINAIQNRAMRYFLGVGRYAPTAAVSGDMGWIPAHVRQWKCIANHWCRSVNMHDDRINRRIFKWSVAKASVGCRNWCYSVTDHFRRLNLADYAHADDFINKVSIQNDIVEAMMDIYVGGMARSYQHRQWCSWRGWQ